MPRAARIAFPSLVYHIISRGNNRESVFEVKEDFEKYLEICRRYKDQCAKVLNREWEGIEQVKKHPRAQLSLLNNLVR